MLSLDNPAIPRCYWESTAESSLTNWYCIRRSRFGLVIGRAVTFIRGITLPEWSTIPTTSNHHTRSAGWKHLREHSLAENCSWRCLDEHTFEVIITQVNRCSWRRVNHCSGRWYDKRKWWYGFPGNLPQVHMDEKRNLTWRNDCGQWKMIGAPSNGRMSSVPTSTLTWRMISAMARALERWRDFQASLIYAKQGQVCILKKVQMRPIMISERTK